MDIEIYTDGGSLNNPGPAACACLIYQNRRLIYKGSFFLGEASNNVAEYMGLIKALEKVLDLKKKHTISSITCYADSQLMIKQLKGEYKIKHGDMKNLSEKIRRFIEEIGISPSFIHIYREQNEKADFLVKEELKNK